MGLKELLSLGALASMKPIVIAILAIVAIILLIIPLFFVWAFGLMTGLIFGVIIFLFVAVAHRLELIDVSDHPLLALLPIIAFAAGVIVEKGRVFQMYPLITLAVISNQPGTATITAEIIFTATALLITVILLVVALGARHR